MGKGFANYFFDANWHFWRTGEEAMGRWIAARADHGEFVAVLRNKAPANSRRQG
jgi:hypothetical protein